jgi:hypothetical protein
VTATTTAGRTVLLALRGPGDLVGELSALDENPRSASLVALEPVQALAIFKWTRWLFQPGSSTECMSSAASPTSGSSAATTHATVTSVERRGGWMPGLSTAVAATGRTLPGNLSNDVL